MATTPHSQIALAADPHFVKRLAALLAAEALVVAAEAGTVPSHDKRRTLAQQAIDQPIELARGLAIVIANSTNLVAATTSYDFSASAIVTDATDAAIRSQIASLWNTLAGV